MDVTRTWKVYGMDGHRQRLSFEPSARYDFTNGAYSDGGTRIIEVFNSDRTGTNEYTIVQITRPTAQLCEDELSGQLSDGLFENVRFGKVEEMPR